MAGSKYADYDVNPSELYQFCESADWGNAAKRCQTHPEEAQIWIYRKNPGGKTIRWCVLPIHQACARSCPRKMIIPLLKAFIGAMRKKSFQMSSEDTAPVSVEGINFSEGNLPIHYACQWGLHEDTIAMMLSAYPDSVKIGDKRGLVPLAIAKQAKIENKAIVVETIENFVKQQASAKDLEKNMTTMERTMARKAKKSKMYADMHASNTIELFESQVKDDPTEEIPVVEAKKVEKEVTKEVAKEVIKEVAAPVVVARSVPVSEPKSKSQPDLVSSNGEVEALKAKIKELEANCTVSALEAQIESLESENAHWMQMAEGQNGESTGGDELLEATIEMLELENEALRQKSEVSQPQPAGNDDILDASIELLEAENAALTAHVQELMTASAASVPAEADTSLLATVELLETENEHLQATIDTIQKGNSVPVNNTSTGIATLTSTAELLEAEVDFLRAINDKLKEGGSNDVAVLTSTAELLEAEIDRLEIVKEGNSVPVNNSSTDSRIATLTSTAELLEAEVDFLRATYDKLKEGASNGVAVLTSTAELLEAEVDSLRARNDKLKEGGSNGVAVLTSTAELLEAEVDSLRATIDKLKEGGSNGVAVLTSTAELLEAEVDFLRARNDKLETGGSNGVAVLISTAELLEAEVDRLEGARSGQGDRVAVITSTAELLEAEIDRLESSKSEQSGKVTVLTATAELLEAEVDRLEQSKDKVGDRNAILTSTAELLEAEVDRLQTLILAGKSDDRIKVLISTAEVLESEVDRLETELAKYKGGAKKQETDVKSVLISTAELLESEVDRLEAKVAELSKKPKESNVVLVRSPMEILESKIELLEYENQTLERKLGNKGIQVIPQSAMVHSPQYVLESRIDMLEIENQNLLDEVDKLDENLSLLVPPNFHATLMNANTKDNIPDLLNKQIVSACKSALDSHDCFTIALSGGSLPGFLSNLSSSFSKLGVDPQFNKWHVLLADERIVPPDDDDNNMKALKSKFLIKVPIPASQIYDIEPGRSKFKFSDTLSQDVAEWYESSVIKPVLSKSGGRLDCAVLGFGPDGHTCSLFPNHPLLDEDIKLVASIENSPKLPPRRITLTYRVLNAARGVIFCGAGASKNPILKAAFEPTKKYLEDGVYDVSLSNPAPYPCAMVRPLAGKVTWIADGAALAGL